MQNNAPEIDAIERIEGQLVDDTSVFFAPAATDLIDLLIAQHDAVRKRIEAMSALVAEPGNATAIGYFLEGNQSDRRAYSDVSRLFNVEGAMNALTASSWGKALNLTDVYDVMPQTRRNAWYQQLNAWKEPRYKRGEMPEVDLPPFDEASVRSTLESLLSMRATFFAERVDGIFRALSGSHVTNVPEGFSKRMITACVLDEYRHVSHQRAGFLNDLRCVIAKFMGRDEPAHNVTSDCINRLAYDRRFGEWVTLDGGALRLRLYMKGTAHVEVSPEISYRLNMVLAQLHPAAIPASFRQKPPKRPKEFRLIGRPLPFAVLQLLQAGTVGPSPIPGAKSAFTFGYASRDHKLIQVEAEAVLASLGGTRQASAFHFDYALRSVLHMVLDTGLVPDDKTFQFYPTPETVATVAAEMAQIGEADTVLEPSAGRGDLADFLPKERTLCIEISELRCAVLAARGYQTVHADFIDWSTRQTRDEHGRRFDRVVLNPPFSDGRALAHLKAAASLVAAGGRITAVLPASLRGKDLLPEWAGEWSMVLTNEFAGTSVSVAVYSADRC